MIQHKLVFHRRPYDEAKLGQLGTVVYVLHPDDKMQVLTIPHPTEEAAAATFAKIRREYFGAHIGWLLAYESEHVDHETWARRPSTPEGMKAAELSSQVHMRGWVKDGTTMVIVMRRDRDVLAAALDEAHDATVLHVLLGLEDNVDQIRRPGFLAKLAKGAAPALRELTLESPWMMYGEITKLPLKVPAALVARLDRLAAVGRDVWPAGCVPPARMTHLRVLSNFKAEAIQEIARAPGLRTLQIALDSKPSQAAARAAFPAMQLDELTAELLDDVAAMMTALLGGTVPPLVQLSGAIPSGAELRAAIARWQRDAPASTTLRFPQRLIDALDAPTRAAVLAAGTEPYGSPFDGSQRSPREQALWARFKPV